MDFFLFYFPLVFFQQDFSAQNMLSQRKNIIKGLKPLKAASFTKLVIQWSVGSILWGKVGRVFFFPRQQGDIHDQTLLKHKSKNFLIFTLGSTFVLTPQGIMKTYSWLKPGSSWRISATRYLLLIPHAQLHYLVDIHLSWKAPAH